MAKKSKTAYFCTECGYESPKWQGKCPSCGSWNSFEEELVTPASKETLPTSIIGEDGKDAIPVKIGEISTQDAERIDAKDIELNRVLGGGIVKGSVVLIGGEPGIGKSTLLLQLALSLSPLKILYVSGEESLQQIKQRAERLTLKSDECYILTDINTHDILQKARKLSPDLIIIDSIQTLSSPHMESAPGSVSQIKECTSELIRFAKSTNIPTFIIGHINKEGAIAGPKVLEHMVDAVISFEGDRHMSYRLIRTSKNRFGSTSEIGLYEMRGSGLRQIHNPSEILISQKDGQPSGVAIGTSMEGNRPLLVEVQALVNGSAYGTPQRSCTGFDSKRLNMLVAVIETHLGVKFNNYDIFLNITGGIKVEDPALDLGVCLALASSRADMPVPDGWCFAAEVGLSGEIRAVQKIEQRILEAEKLGYKRILISKFSTKEEALKKYKIEVTVAGNLGEASRIVWGDF